MHCHSGTTIQSLLGMDPETTTPVDFGQEQRKDPKVQEIIHFLENGELPTDTKQAKKVVTQQMLFAVVDKVLYYVDPKQDYQRRVVVPQHLRERILAETHCNVTGGHFSGKRTYGALVSKWWWEGMYVDAVRYVENCPECTIVMGTGRHHNPPLHPILVDCPFQILGIDLMELPKTHRGNKYVVVIQDYLTKWPLVYPLADQKAQAIAKILVEEVIPFFGVPESLLSDRGTNLLSHLMKELCSMLGIMKLNTTAYHPQCDGMVERLTGR